MAQLIAPTEANTIFTYLTQAEYDALGVKEPTKTYAIVPAGTEAIRGMYPIVAAYYQGNKEVWRNIDFQPGSKWIPVGLPNLIGGIRSICWSEELKLFTAFTTTLCLTSSDGYNWTQYAKPSAIWNSICWSKELSVFVAVGETGTGARVATSTDGVNWTARSSAADNTWTSVCWSPQLNLFVAVSSSGTGNRVMTSPDGVTWSLQASAADSSWSCVIWVAELNLYFATAPTGTNGLMTSPDGVTWTLQNSIGRYGAVEMCWSPQLGLLVAISNQGVGVFTSTDGVSWTRRETPAGKWISICWSPDLSVFALFRSNISPATPNAISSDGLTWFMLNSTPHPCTKCVWSPFLGIFVAASVSPPAFLIGQ